MSKPRWLALMGALAIPALPASANVVTDWDDIAIKTFQAPGPVPPIPVDVTYRAGALVNVAMFNAVNCIEPKYRPFKTQLEPSPDTSQVAAAASAAANVLMQIVPNSNVKQQLADYLAKVPDDPAKDRGIQLGEEIATRLVKMRADDGSTARNAYRPITEPGRYVPTAFTVGWWGSEENATPFVLGNAAQFRPGPPPDLKSEAWARDYNEIKEIVRHQANAAADRNRNALAYWWPHWIPSMDTADCHQEEYVGSGQRTLHGSDCGGGSRCRPIRVRREMALYVLASHDRHSQRRYRRE
jgi:hypothetical protein